MFPQPTSYKDIVLQPVVATLLDDIVTNRLTFPGPKNGLLLHGPFGTGKSTLAHLLPRFLDINRGGSGNVTPIEHAIVSGSNGTQLIASINATSETLPFSDKFHYFVLDELDNLGTAAMKSMKVVMDRKTSIFIMTTNNLKEIDRGIVSRSHEVDMSAPPSSAWVPKIQAALLAAGVTRQVLAADIESLVELCTGDVRKIITQAEQLRNDLQ